MNRINNFHKNMGWQRLIVIISNLAIGFIWFWLFRPVFSYLSIIFTRQEFRTNQILLFAVLGLVILEIRRKRFRLPLADPPQLHLPGLALAFGGALAFLAAERWLDINTLSAALSGLATYGLIGCWMDRRAWWWGMPAALLLVGTLPFGEHMDTFIGYPLRLATAQTVSQGLAGLGVPNLGVDTILIFENGLSQVDNPCSGVKSLWTGALFLLAATWIERRPINKRWLLAAISFAGLLIIANLARVVLLVLIGQVLGLRLLAEMLHVPLGVIGFIAACGAALLMLRWVGSSAGAPVRPPISTTSPKWLAPGVTVVLLGLLLLSTPRPDPASAASINLPFPEVLNYHQWPLDEAEMNWLSDDGAVPVAVVRGRFEWQGMRGSLILIASDTWRAHHRPERCFTVYGLDIKSSRLHMAGEEFPLRWLDLGKAGENRTLVSAGYWLQSRQRVTDDYSVRIWDDLGPQPEPWILVTVLFDKPENPGSAEIDALFALLRQSVAESLSANASD